MAALKYIENIPFYLQSSFTSKVDTIAAALGINANWLMVVMYAESKLNPKAVNPYSGATGLIQFLRSTAAGLGTSTAALLQMDAVTQLDYVLLYFRPYAGRMDNIFDVYMAVFSPKYIGAARNTVMYSQGSAAYSGNRALDLEGDGQITVGNVHDWFEQFIPVGTAKTNSIFTLQNLAYAVGFFIIIKPKKRKNGKVKK